MYSENCFDNDLGSGYRTACGSLNLKPFWPFHVTWQ